MAVTRPLRASRRRLSRRGALGLMGASALVACSDPATTSEPADSGFTPGETGFLRSFVSGRTVDIHAHLGAADWYTLPPGGEPDPQRVAVGRSPYFRQAAIARRAAQQSLPPEERAMLVERRARWDDAVTFEDGVRLILSECDDAGIDTIVNLAQQNWPGPGPGGRRIGVTYERILEDNMRAREAFPGRLITFAGIDPRLGDDAPRLLEVAVRDFGCAGYGELTGTMWNVRPDDAALVYPLIEKAIELDVPFVSDATMPFGFSTPAIFATIIRDFPELRLCLGGTGSGVLPMQRADGSRVTAHDAMLELAEANENVWLDLDDWQAKGFEQGLGIGSPESIAVFLEFLKRALSGPARGRIMYGSDHPVFADLFTHRSWIERFVIQAEDQGFTNDDWEAFFSANPRAFLKL